MFGLNTLAIAGVALLGLAQSSVIPERSLTKRDGCKGQPPGKGWASPILYIGGTVPDADCASQWGGDFTPVQSIEVWTAFDGDHIAGIQYTFTSKKKSPMYGTPDIQASQPQVLQIPPGDTISSAQLWGNGHGEWLGHIHLETSSGKALDAGADLGHIGNRGYTVNVGGGLLMGGLVATRKRGDSNDLNIDNMALLFIDAKVTKVSIGDVRYSQNYDGTNNGIDDQSSINVGQWHNHEDQNQTYSYAMTQGVTKSHSFAQSSANAWGLSVSTEFSGEVLGIGIKTNYGFQWTHTNTDTTTVEDSETSTVTCGASGTVAANSGQKVTGSMASGKSNFDYTSTVTVKLDDGTTYTYPESGTLTNQAYTDCTVSYDKVPNSSSDPSDTSPLTPDSKAVVVNSQSSASGTSTSTSTSTSASPSGTGSLSSGANNGTSIVASAINSGWGALASAAAAAAASKSAAPSAS